MTSWLVRRLVLPAAVLIAACGQPGLVTGASDAAGNVGADAGVGGSDAGADAGSDAGVDAGADAGTITPGAYANRIVSFTPGPGAGFGQSSLPGIVLGPPEGAGSGAGSFDVLSLGNGGEIILAFDGLVMVDRPGVDLLVFENAFAGFSETGVVGVSDDGINWTDWPCASDDVDAGFPGCAGVHPVFSSTTSGISAFDPAAAGGDGFDLATLGLSRARYVRIRDTGKNRYAPTSGGFDLDAIAILHVTLPDGGPR